MQLLTLFYKTETSEILREKGISKLVNGKWHYVGEAATPLFKTTSCYKTRYTAHKKFTGDSNLLLQSLVHTDSKSFCSMLEQFYISEFGKVCNKPGGPKMLVKRIKADPSSTGLRYYTYVCSYDEFGIKYARHYSANHLGNYFPLEVINQQLSIVDEEAQEMEV